MHFNCVTIHKYHTVQLPDLAKKKKKEHSLRRFPTNMPLQDLVVKCNTKILCPPPL